jgi:hypothetical protein
MVGNMCYHRILGTVTGLIGIALTIYAIHSMSVISKAKSEVQNMSSQTSVNYVGKRINSDMQSIVHKHDQLVKIGLYTGIILTVAGGYFFFVCKKKKKK